MEREEELEDIDFLQERELATPLAYIPSCISQEDTGVRLQLDATLSSSLEWKGAKAAAENYKQLGLNILWDINFGLFADLTHPLEHQGQFHSLSLGIKHFLTTLWCEFNDITCGIALLNAPMPKQASEINYLDMLRMHIPDALDTYLICDMQAIDSLAEEAYLLNQERFPHMHVITRGARIQREGLVLINNHICKPKETHPQTGVCLPSLEAAFDAYAPRLESVLNQLQQGGENYRLIPENLLSGMWHGLDTLFYLSAYTSTDGMRKIKGFEAAGGVAISL